MINNSNLSINFNFMLNLPGDFYEFTVDVVNKGTIDAMIESFEKTPELTEEQAKYLNYIIEYQNGEQLGVNQVVKAGESVRLKVVVEYRKDLNEEDLPTIDNMLNLGFTVNYVQADNNSISVNDNGIWLIEANGSLDDIGTIVTIGTEQFYTIGTEGNNVKLFSMYNLYVGGEFDDNTEEFTFYGEEATGMQDENMKGSSSSSYKRRGIIQFSNISKKGILYSDYIGSKVEDYVNNYKVKFERKFVLNIVEARLILKEELISNEIGCIEAKLSCNNAPEWIHSTSYWTGTASGENKVWTVSDTKYFKDYTNFVSNGFGVRPVIVISKDYF